MSTCVACEVHVHSGVNLNSKWHLFSDLYGKNCFEILHLEICDGLWGSKSDVMGKYGVYTSHTAYILLQSKYRVDRKKE